MIARFHSRVIEILKHRRLVLDLQILQIAAGGQIAACLREEIRSIKTQRVADKHDPLGRSFPRFRRMQTQGMQRQWQCGADFQEVSSIEQGCG